MKARIKVRSGVSWPFFETEVVVEHFGDIDAAFLHRYNAEFETHLERTYSIAEVLTLYTVEITITET